MAAGGLAFILRAKSKRSVFLWCLRVNEARDMRQRAGNRIRLFVGYATEVLTGHRKGQHAMAREVLEALPILGEPAASVAPGDGAFEDPALGQRQKALRLVGSLDDLYFGRAENPV